MSGAMEKLKSQKEEESMDYSFGNHWNSFC